MAWQEGRREDVLALGTEALGHWGATSVTYHYMALCLWPLLAVHLEMKQLAEALVCARRMLEARQVRFPDDLERLLEEGVTAGATGQDQPPGHKLAEALARATALHYA